MQTITILARVRCVSVMRSTWNIDRSVSRDRGRTAITRYIASVHATRAVNGMVQSEANEGRKFARVMHRVFMRTHDLMPTVTAEAFAFRRYAPMPTPEQEATFPKYKRKASVMRSRLSAECLTKAGAFADQADATDAGLAEVIRQWARIAGIQANGTDYSKPETARGSNSDRMSEVRGEIANVRFTARWRDGYSQEKADNAARLRELAYWKAALPHLVDSEGEMRTGRILKDGRIVYGRDKVTSDVLWSRYLAKCEAEDAVLASDADIAQRLAYAASIERTGKADAVKRQRTKAEADAAELAELMAAQRVEMNAQRRAKLSKADKAAPSPVAAS